MAREIILIFLRTKILYQILHTYFHVEYLSFVYLSLTISIFCLIFFNNFKFYRYQNQARYFSIKFEYKVHPVIKSIESIERNIVRKIYF